MLIWPRCMSALKRKEKAKAEIPRFSSSKGYDVLQMTKWIMLSSDSKAGYLLLQEANGSFWVGGWANMKATPKGMPLAGWASLSLRFFQLRSPKRKGLGSWCRNMGVNYLPVEVSTSGLARRKFWLFSPAENLALCSNLLHVAGSWAANTARRGYTGTQQSP